MPLDDAFLSRLPGSMRQASPAGGWLYLKRRSSDHRVGDLRVRFVLDPQDPSLRKAFNSRWPPERLAEACGNLATGTRVYGAAVFASDPEAAPVQDFLARLARHLGLPPNTVAAVQTKLRKRRVA